MWIIPKPLHTLASVQDTEALILDYNELSVLSEQSLLARSNPSSAKTWSQRWKKGSLNQHLYGRILKPSLGSHFEDEWTSSVEASLVSPSLVQETEKEMKTPDISGPTSSEELRYADLPFFSLKTSKESSAQSSDKIGGQTSRELQYSFMSLESWNAEVIARRGDCSQRAKLGHLTLESESSFSVQTLKVQNETSSQTPSSLWRTPTLLEERRCLYSDPQKLFKVEEEGSQVSLFSQVLQATPPQEAESSMIGNPQESQMDQTSTASQMNSDCSEMELSPTPPVELSPSYGGNWPTPRTRDYKGCSSNPKSRGYGETLPDAIKSEVLDESQMGLLEGDLKFADPSGNWTTPNTRDYIDASLKKDLPTRKDGKSRDDHLPRQVLHDEGYRGKLNPRWVETLMGLPVGWVQPSCEQIVFNVPLSKRQVSADGILWPTPTTQDTITHENAVLTKTGRRINGGTPRGLNLADVALREEKKKLTFGVRQP
jgi:hypothetical protein